MQEIIIGFFAGYFSGHFGLGGGLITTPAIRLLLGGSAYIAVGTPLLVNIPSAAVGAISYYRRGFLAPKYVLVMALTGAVGAIGGAAVTRFVSGDIILLITSVVIFLLSWRFILAPKERLQDKPQKSQRMLAISGLGIGFLSGFLGLGGGFLLVPFLNLVVGLDIKTAFGTSLAIVGAITIPGAFIHFLLGHVDPQLGLLLVIGVMPGALIGSRVAMKMPGQWLRFMFGFLLSFVALYLAGFEILQLAS